MNHKTLLSAIHSPEAVHEVSLGQTDFLAIVISSVGGAFVIASAAMISPPDLTTTLIIALAILYGPLLGFVACSMFAGTEMFIGRILGGQASFSALYRLLSWSFLPFASAIFLCGLMEKSGVLPDSVDDLIETVILIIFAALSVRNYYSNVRIEHQLSRLRTAASLTLSLVVFIGLIALCLRYLIRFFVYGTNAGLM